MSAGTPSQSNVWRSRRGSAQLFFESVATAVLAAFFIAGAGITVSPTSLHAKPARDVVNRIGKADRLQLPPYTPAAGSKLPYGCEPLVSPLASARLARLARQCVS